MMLEEDQSATAQEIIDYARNKKAPWMIEFVDSMPLGPAGKLLKRELKEKVLGNLKTDKHERGWKIKGNLNKEEKMIIDEVRRIVRREIAPLAAELDERGGFPDHTHKIFAENDLLNPLLPIQYGGVGLSYMMFSPILSEVARACAASSRLLIAQADRIMDF